MSPERGLGVGSGWVHKSQFLSHPGHRSFLHTSRMRTKGRRALERSVVAALVCVNNPQDRTHSPLFTAQPPLPPPKPPKSQKESIKTSGGGPQRVPAESHSSREEAGPAFEASGVQSRIAATLEKKLSTRCHFMTWNYHVKRNNYHEIA